jgi:Fe-S-cluster containining protein
MVNSELITDIIVYTRFTIITDIINQSPLNIPVFCQLCGQCCKEIAFPEPLKYNKLLHDRIKQVCPSTTDNIALNDPNLIQRVKKKPCMFLRDDNQCSIYPERPKLCREWYPRGGSNCPAIRHHKEMCQTLLENCEYQIGVREIIYIGETLLNPSYPLVQSFDEITQKILYDYILPPEEVVKDIKQKLDSLELTKDQMQIFLAINPILNRIQ